MITGTLKVTPDKLKTTASDFKSQSTKTRTLTQNMISLVNGMSSIWQGEAQQQYVNKFKSLDGDMAQMVLLINEHVDDLNAMADNYAKTETTNTSAAQALPVDYIEG